MKRITITLSDREGKLLSKIAKEKNVCEAHIINAALYEYLEKVKVEEPKKEEALKLKTEHNEYLPVRRFAETMPLTIKAAILSEKTIHNFQDLKKAIEDGRLLKYHGVGVAKLESLKRAVSEYESNENFENWRQPL